MSNSSPDGSVSSKQASTTISLMSEHVECLPPHPVLPAEIWDMIRLLVRDECSKCKSQDDLVRLWRCVRPVCKEFKATIEDDFKTRHLAKTVLHFITGRSISVLCFFLSCLLSNKAYDRQPLACCR